jgi:nitrogen fixation protein
LNATQPDEWGGKATCRRGWRREMDEAWEGGTARNS